MLQRTWRPATTSLHRDRNTLGPVLAVVSLILACSAAAGEFYVPLSSGAAGPSFVTELRIVNQSENSTTVVIEGLDAFGPAGETTRLILAAGEATEWSDVVVEHRGSQRFGALAIRADGQLLVTAIRLDASADAIATVPVLDAHDAIGEGAITLATRPNEPIWKSGIGIVNPDVLGVLLTITLHRCERVMHVASVYVPGRGVRVLSIDDLFGSEADRDDWLSFSAPRSVLLFGYEANQQTGAQFFTPAAPAAAISSRRRAVRRGLPPTTLQTVVLTPSKDNTLYQTSNGSLSNGVGVHLFSGRTNRGELRRALVAFDVVSQIPPGSQITSVALKLEVSQTVSGPQSMELHRVSADWGEGSSNAGGSQDGDGAPSRAGDATWIHTFFPDRRWSRPGGDFEAAADDAALDSGAVTWGSSPAMIARVQGWLDQPPTNFGWIIVGNEADARTAKRFDSRESVSSVFRPSLTVEFRK